MRPRAAWAARLRLADLGDGGALQLRAGLLLLAAVDAGAHAAPVQQRRLVRLLV